MVKKIPRLFTHTPSQRLEACSVIELEQELNEKANVAAHIDKMSACTFEFWLPNLQRHGFGEYLLSEFKPSAMCTHGGFVINDMSSLDDSVKVFH